MGDTIQGRFGRPVHQNSSDSLQRPPNQQHQHQAPLPKVPSETSPKIPGTQPLSNKIPVKNVAFIEKGKKLAELNEIFLKCRNLAIHLILINVGELISYLNPDKGQFKLYGTLKGWGVQQSVRQTFLTLLLKLLEVTSHAKVQRFSFKTHVLTNLFHN